MSKEEGKDLERKVKKEGKEEGFLFLFLVYVFRLVAWVQGLSIAALFPLY